MIACPLSEANFGGMRLTVLFGVAVIARVARSGGSFATVGRASLAPRSGSIPPFPNWDSADIPHPPTNTLPPIPGMGVRIGDLGDRPRWVGGFEISPEVADVSRLRTRIANPTDARSAASVIDFATRPKIESIAPRMTLTAPDLEDVWSLIRIAGDAVNSRVGRI